MEKAKYTPRIGSEIFETSVMKTEECYLFVKAATSAGADLETAYEDMKMIDDLLHIKKIHFGPYSITARYICLAKNNLENMEIIAFASKDPLFFCVSED
jgi:hypothetical protein